MATTAAGTPYVESSDLVANYPGVSLALADHIDGLDGGKVLQVVRATDSTSRTTSSTIFVDVTGMSITITPRLANSTIILICAYSLGQVGNTVADVQITDSANTAISGGQLATFQTSSANSASYQTIFAQDTPGSISAKTFKMRFKNDNGNPTTIRNNLNTGQMYAFEVAA
jgi:hypothetical protein